MAKSTRKGEFHPCTVFSTKALLGDGVIPNVNFVLSDSNNKDQLRDFFCIII